MEKDYVFLLEDGEVGYAYFYEREGKSLRDEDEENFAAYLYQTRFPMKEFLHPEKREVMLQEAKIQIADVATSEEAHKEILNYWMLPETTSVLELNVDLESAVKALSDEHPIISF